VAVQLREINLSRTLGLDLYRNLDGVEGDVDAIMSLGARVGAELGTRRVWMLSASEFGSSSAELIPALCRLLSHAGVDARWLVIEPGDAEFLDVAKALAEQLYGEQPEGSPPAERRELFDRVSREMGEALAGYLDPQDIVVVHGTPLVGLAAVAGDGPHRSRFVWHCHVGSPQQNEHTAAAWELLRPYLEGYARVIFSERRYVPAFLRNQSAAILPGIDPLSHKNRELRPYKLSGILRSAGLIERPAAPGWAEWEGKVEVLEGNRWHRLPIPHLLHRPLVLQVSRFDRLKGFDHLIAGFHHLLKTYAERLPKLRVDEERVSAELESLELVVAGPDPDGMPEYPMAALALKRLGELHAALPPDVARRVHLLKLPMTSRKENALLVNALQRLATVVVQCSLRQGFGLAVTEALWKGTPVVVTRAGGIGVQVRAEVDGTLIDDPSNPEQVAMAILQAIGQRREAEAMARSGHRRVAENFLILDTLHSLLEEFDGLLTRPAQPRLRPVEAGERAPERHLRSIDRTA
jgi:trehalose synthase